MSAFTPAGSGGAPVQATVTGSINPQVVNVPMASASTEYSYSLPSGTKQYLIKLRNGSSPIQLAYVLGESSTNYLTVPRYCFYAESDLSTTSVTIYFQSPTASQVAEITVWT